MGTPFNKDCRVCGCGLTTDNTTPSRARNNDWICRRCRRAARKPSEVQEERRRERLRAKRRPFNSALHDIRRRAKAKGLPHDITRTYLVSIMPDRCPIMGIPFDLSGGNSRYAPTVDRLIPEKGYVMGNVQIISRLANQMKQDATDDELWRFAEWVVSREG